MMRKDAARETRRLAAAAVGAVLVAGAMAGCAGTSDHPDPRQQSAPTPAPSARTALPTTEGPVGAGAGPASARFGDPCLPALAAISGPVVGQGSSIGRCATIEISPFDPAAASPPVVLDPLWPRTTWPLRGA